MTIPPLPLVSHSYQIVGSAHNSLEYLAEALDLVASGAVKPMIEVFPKERVAEAFWDISACAAHLHPLGNSAVHDDRCRSPFRSACHLTILSPRR